METAHTRLATELPIESYTLPRRPWRRYVTSFEDILDHHYKGAGTESDPYVVDWLRDDAEDPQNFPASYKWFQVGLTSLLTLAVTLASSGYAGGIKSLMIEFGGSSELPHLLTLALFVLGFAFGPLLWAPTSEVFGRRIVYLVSCFFLTLWLAVTIVAPNPAAILVFRGLSGFFGSSPLTNAGGTVSDLLTAEQRGIGMALFSAAPFLGPALGPISGGYIGDAAGWKWVMGFLAILCGVVFVVLVLFTPETYAPTLLRQRAERLSKATGKVYRYRGDAQKPLEVIPLFRAALLRPWRFLLEPVVLILSIYISIIYGTLYLNFAAYPIIFQQMRGWSSGEQGLAFLGIAGGVVIAITVVLLMVNKAYVKASQQKGTPPPEERLQPAFMAGVICVVGLAGFAATCGPNVHWIASILFGIPFGFGMVLIFLSTMGYLVDSYTIYAASVLAANSVLRSLFGAAFPLFTPKMYERLGVHWAAAIPGFLAFACVPFPLIFYKYGAAIRARSKYAADAERTMKRLTEERRAELEEEEAAGKSGDLYVAGGEKPALGRVKTGASITRPSHPKNDAWIQWRVLAERDEVDLSDEQRMSVQQGAREFAPYHHPSSV
ncbi:uncharacterized protein COLE_07199 [Cutaneotrichosporon oleaginosum]|uniref:uncharacterized protein n=1 Tax=Cutaneotrichosporon oleaginosum TaxID=879819 RepID=UPI001328041A|nr:hypothetical protein COLE_07199 [Cutaneotrichosporon oleaginosum]